MIKKAISSVLFICIVLTSWGSLQVAAEGVPIVYNSKSAFTTDHNNGSDGWLWQYYDYATKMYVNFTKTGVVNEVPRWVRPNPWDETKVNDGALQAAVEAENMYPENMAAITADKTSYAVKTFVSSYTADALITKDGDFKGGHSEGKRATKIMQYVAKTGQEIKLWPTETDWDFSNGSGIITGFPDGGVVTTVEPGDMIRFILRNTVPENGDAAHYNNQARWVPVVTLTNAVPPLETVTRTYSAKEAFSIEHNDGRNRWLWRTWDMLDPTNPYGLLRTLTSTTPEDSLGEARWVRSWNAEQTSLASKNAWTAVGSELMWPDGRNEETDKKEGEHAAVRTFIVPIEGWATITNEIFANRDAGYSRAKITVASTDSEIGRQVWPSGDDWALSNFGDKNIPESGIFPNFPAEGVKIYVNEGEYINFILYNKAGTRYNARAKWAPIVTLEHSAPFADVELKQDTGNENLYTAYVKLTNQTEITIPKVTPIIAVYELRQDEVTNMQVKDKLVSVAIGESVELIDVNEASASIDLGQCNIQGKDLVFYVYVWNDAANIRALDEPSCFYSIETGENGEEDD